MRTIYFWAIIALCFAYQGHVLAQGCSEATAQFDLDVNNVSARILSVGDLWWDPISQISHYEVPKGSGKNIFFAGGLWMGAIDTFGQLRIAAQTYRQTGSDYFPGVLDNNGETNAATCGQFDQIWSVLGSTINGFIADFNASGGTLPVASIPESILQWPGRNNVYFSDFTLPTNKDLAPFYDADNDGNYDPTKGDYPVIAQGNSQYADQMAWCIFNDNGNVHGETGGMPLQVEVGLLAYSFLEPNTPAINNATFYRYTVRNYSPASLDSCVIGLWVDPDLGGYLDDYVGCIPDQNVGYVYNCDGEDGIYGSPPPIAAVHFLDPINDENNEDTEMGTFASYSNNPTATGNPEVYDDYYNYLNAQWKDNTPFTVGGNGYGGSTPTRFVFPDNPAQANGWSECAEGNPCGDRRFLMAMQPISIERYGAKNFTIGVYFVPEAGGCPNVNINPLSGVINTSVTYHQMLSLLNVEASLSIGSGGAAVKTSIPFTTCFDAQNKLCLVSSNNNDVQQISVYNHIGQQVVRPFTVHQSAQIDTRTWASGYYLITATDKNGKRFTQKVVVY